MNSSYFLDNLRSFNEIDVPYDNIKKSQKVILELK